MIRKQRQDDGADFALLNTVHPGALEVSELPGQLRLPAAPGAFQQAFIVPCKAVGGTDERILTGIQ